jgi:hypothetical protein
LKALAVRVAAAKGGVLECAPPYRGWARAIRDDSEMLGIETFVDLA